MFWWHRFVNWYFSLHKITWTLYSTGFKISKIQFHFQPLLFNGEHRLNVEEKKPKEGRPASGRGGGPPRGMMGRGAMGNTGRGGMRGGMGARSERGSMGGRGGMGAPRRWKQSLVLVVLWEGMQFWLEEH